VGDILPAAAAQLHFDTADRSERPAFDLHYPHIRTGRDRQLSIAVRSTRPSDGTLAGCPAGRGARATASGRAAK